MCIDTARKRGIKEVRHGYILAQIWARTQNPNYEKVATLYNMMSATKVDGYGKTIVHYMEHRPWLSKSW